METLKLKVHGIDFVVDVSVQDEVDDFYIEINSITPVDNLNNLLKIDNVADSFCMDSKEYLESDLLYSDVLLLLRKLQSYYFDTSYDDFELDEEWDSVLVNNQ